MSRIYAISVLATLCRRSLQSALLTFALAGSAMAATDVVTTYKDDAGWKLLVNGEDYYIKGMVWSYTPRGENYTYNLWGQSDEKVMKILDYDFGLLHAAGVNTIRTFNSIPAKWVTYVYEKYGIRTIINHLAARYGNSYSGAWTANTNYQDPATREAMKKDVLDTVEKYKDTKGLLMIALGNEANYGLSWSSFEIENFPEGEQQKEKARYLYSIYNEIIVDAKKINPNVPYTIVNGDLQYIDLIKEICTDIDLLGTNVYRGISFTSLWKDVDEKLGLPVVLMEFGADAFNARTNAEDQLSQATWLKGQWQEMYHESYGNGGVGNSIGGTVFEWRDEWWKYKQTENLDKHDNNASWGNGGYPYDFVEGKHNMNEEWWGVVSLGTPNNDGVYTAGLRMAYDVLTEVWKIDPYTYKVSAINKNFDDMNMDYMQLKSDVRLLKAGGQETNEGIRFSGGSLRGEWVLKGSENAIDVNGENGVGFTHGEMAFLDFQFDPSDKITGQFSLNILGSVADKDDFEISYGRRGLPLEITVPGTNNQVPLDTETLDGRERVELYDFEVSYSSKEYDFTTFYHVPRYHWKYEGDFYGLLREATDIDENGSINNMDIWNAKAPFGAQFTGKDEFSGLTLLFGPEVFWGANPLIMLKYDFKIGNSDFTVMHSEEVARKGDSSSASDPTSRQSRFSTAYMKTMLTDDIKLELGGIFARSERIGDEFFYTTDGVNVMKDEIELKDTLGAKLKLSIGNFYLKLNHSGLVADGGEPLRELGYEGTHLPLTEAGNRKEAEMGWQLNFGSSFMLFPRLLYRDNLIAANPSIDTDIATGNPGLSPRNDEDDPFAVTGNRKARSAELFFTYDPTGETFFYDWDNDRRENADFAFNIGATYTEYPTATDSHLFFFAQGGFNAPFGVGLPAEDVWTVSSKMVFNPSVDQKMIFKLSRSFGQSTGDPTGGSRKTWNASANFIFHNKHFLDLSYVQDAWGPYDFYRQFNITYPQQYKLDYSFLLDSKQNRNKSSKVGIRLLLRTLDENSPAEEYLDGANDYDFLSIFYFKWAY